MTERVPLTLIGAEPTALDWWKPNWIDYRSSVANVDRRKDSGEVVELCRECGCEADLEPVPHSPKCPTLETKNGTPARKNRTVPNNADRGLELLERMDAGESLEDDDEPLVDVAAVVDDDADRDEPVEPLAEAERAASFGADSGDGSSRKPKRKQGELIEEARAALAGGPKRLRDLAADLGYSSSESLGSWIIDQMRAGTIVRVERGVYALTESSERETDGESGDDSADGAASAVVVREPPARSENESGRRRAWDKDDVIAAIQRWNDEYGHPPTSTEWVRRVDGYPTTTTVAARFGSWANAIEAAGFPRPTRGGIPLKPTAAPAKRVRVRGTGLTYATAEEAYVAADEIEADGQRVAEQARFDGNEPKAEQAIDQSRELAEKIRDAAHAFEARTSGSSTSSEVEKPEVRLDNAMPFRAIALSLIAGMRAAADALERELGDLE